MENNQNNTKESFLNVVLLSVALIAGFIWIGNKVLKTSGAK